MALEGVGESHQFNYTYFIAIPFLADCYYSTPFIVDFDHGPRSTGINVEHEAYRVDLLHRSISNDGKLHPQNQTGSTVR